MHAPALTLKDFCDAYRVCRETAYQQIPPADCAL